MKNYSSVIRTGNLSAHLESVHGVKDTKPKTTKQMQTDLRNIFTTEKPQVAVTSPASKRKWQLGRDLVLMVARDLTAFEKVESEGFVDFLKV